MLTHGNVMANMVTSRLRIILQGLTVNSPGKQSGMLINVPLFHATGLLTSFLQGLDMGRKHVILPGKWDADVAAVWFLCRRSALP